MQKPTRKMVWKGQKGSKWRDYTVRWNGKTFHHLSKKEADQQYNAAMRVYKKRTARAKQAKKRKTTKRK